MTALTTTNRPPHPSECMRVFVQTFHSWLSDHAGDGDDVLGPAAVQVQEPGAVEVRPDPAHEPGTRSRIRDVVDRPGLDVGRTRDSRHRQRVEEVDWRPALKKKRPQKGFRLKRESKGRRFESRCRQDFLMQYIHWKPTHDTHGTLIGNYHAWHVNFYINYCCTCGSWTCDH